MKFRILAAFAALAVTLGVSPSIDVSSTGGLHVSSMTSAAYADVGRKGKIYWVSATSQEDAVTQILTIVARGDEARFGSPKNYTSYALNPVTRELRLNEVVRPDGVNKNHSVTTIVSLDTGMAVQRNEAGVVVARFQVGSEQMNGTAMLVQGLTNMLPALANGVGAAGVQAVVNPCGNGRCGQQGVINVVTANAGSNALSSLTSNGACTTCAPTDPKH